MRAQLVMNPEARGVTAAMKRVVQAALEARFKLDTVETKARDAGIAIAREAVSRGIEWVIAFGGDGLVNEVVNGMAGTDATLAIIPGGTMNVFARNLGLPPRPLEATDLILRFAEERRPKEVRLGSVGDRWFTFACGCGFDAEAARRVESHLPSKRRFGEPYFYAAALATFAASYVGKHPFLRVRGSFGEEEAVMAVVTMGDPYAYLGGRPVRLGERRGGKGLDLLLLRRMMARHFPYYAMGAFMSGRFGPEARTFSGLEEVEVEADGGFEVHVDGEPLPPFDHARIRLGSEALKVLT